MKLVCCITCNLIINISKKERTCECGNIISAKYVDDINVEIIAKDLDRIILLGFSNPTFQESIYEDRIKPNHEWGYNFVAFVIQKSCKTFKLIEKGE